MKLKDFRWYGCFYECEGNLGWMPLWQAVIVKIFAPDAVNWVKQKDVIFSNKAY